MTVISLCYLLQGLLEQKKDTLPKTTLLSLGTMIRKYCERVPEECLRESVSLSKTNFLKQTSNSQVPSKVLVTLGVTLGGYILRSLPLSAASGLQVIWGIIAIWTWDERDESLKNGTIPFFFFERTSSIYHNIKNRRRCSNKTDNKISYSSTEVFATCIYKSKKRYCQIQESSEVVQYLLKGVAFFLV